MVYTCLDLLHVISIVSRYMICLGKEYWQEVKWILRYLKDTANMGLTFLKDNLSESTICYVYSDFKDDLDKRGSLIGYSR